MRSLAVLTTSCALGDLAEARETQPKAKNRLEKNFIAERIMRVNGTLNGGTRLYTCHLEKYARLPMSKSLEVFLDKRKGSCPQLALVPKYERDG